MGTLRQLVEDGLESLGTIELGGTLVVGDPTTLAGPSATGGWAGIAVRPGTWHVLARPWFRDRDLLDEVVLAHASAIPSFYEQYDDAQPVAALLLPIGRVCVLDGVLRTDLDVIRQLAEPDREALPFVLDRALVLSGIEQNPAHVIAPRSSEALLVVIGLGRAPGAIAVTESFARDRDPDE
ncbi:MAG: hypothetical protein ABMB14_36900 [Myxococcota bacterium]